MDTLNFKKTRCSIQNLNTRTENDGDSKALAYDLSVQMTIPFLMIHDLFEGEQAALEDFLWGENGGLYFNRIRHISLEHEFEDHGMKIQVGKDDKDELWPIKIGKLTIVPLDDKKVTLNMRIQFRPEEDDYPILHRALINEAWIQIIKPKQLSIGDANKSTEADGE